ncbi:hypothetical protein [Streptomyces sp. WMMB 322]|uniref:hypothetical protein n=1 Tax=Streptomyces sp. WMMB 322 TaxID=1286821 RepID=UPI0006E4300A|nr:hypothetical protein [Streptomyces sp. WMMB 322]SCK47264.1 hypothetical protein H180DRAFT_04218 [Streptomyces sp. WMMB 322]
MVISLSAVVLFGAILLILIRHRAMHISGALTAVLFGFFLASTGIAPVINELLNSAQHALTNL